MNEEKLSQLRAKIDALDAQIVDLISQRAKIALEIGQLKSKGNLNFWDPKREKEIFARLKSINKGHYLIKLSLTFFTKLLRPPGNSNVLPR